MLTMKLTETINYKTQAVVTRIGPGHYDMGGGNADGWLFCRTLPRIIIEKTNDITAWEKFLVETAKRIKYLTKFTNTFDITVVIKEGRREIYHASVIRSGKLGLPVEVRIWKNELKI